MAQRLKAVGQTGGFTWDDGSDYDDVSKIYVRGRSQGIHFILFEYPKSGQVKSGKLSGIQEGGFTEIFEINHLNNEHLESVEVYYEDDKYGYIKALQFKTNYRVSEIIGYETDTKFSLAVKGKKIVGFYGYLTCMGTVISLGAYFTWITPSRLEAKGGRGGTSWDDGADHEGITKIHVRGGSEGIQYIKFDYVKSGQPKVGVVHGLSGRGFTQTFKINHVNNEHLVSVEGYYDDESGVIQGLQFITNIKTSDMMGYEKGNKFSLTKKGNKIVGFHGNAEKNLNSLGAYYTTIPLTRSECHGGSGGSPWDDGVFIGIKKVICSHNKTNVGRIKFEYHDTVRSFHGDKYISEKEEEFELDYPNEFITSVEGTLKSFSPDDNVKVTSLIFKSSKERTSPTFGIVSGTKFVLESKGCALVGFHGRHSKFDLLAIGAYFYPFPPLSTTNKLEAIGGDGGALWEDGVFDGVRKIYVGQGDNGVAFLKFVYDEDNKVVIGDDHGSKKLLDVKEFELDYPSEYITAVDGCYDKVIGSEVEVITMLRFKTNKRTSIPVGFESASSFLLYKEGYKIVGFHGKASNMINQLGVHAVPFTE